MSRTLAAFEAARERLDALTRRPPPEGALAAGVALLAADGTERAWLGGRDGPEGAPVADPGLRLRVASVTKMAVAATVLAHAGPRGPVDLDAPLDPWPAGGAAPTMRHLLAHLSGLTDDAGYVVPPPQAPEAFVAAHPAARSEHPPGTFFRYANLNTVLAGAVLERATGRPLGALVRDVVLRPAGVGGGLNWFGVADRARRLPAWQWRAGRHEATADRPGDDWGADLIWRDGAGVSMDGWRPGHAAWFSPQGGLRASVVELARLARAYVPEEPPVEWRLDGANGRDGGGLFRAYGPGLTILDGHPAIGGRLAGHAGHALGVSCGAWRDLSTGDAWAYALTGWPDRTEGLDDEAFLHPEEVALLRLFAGSPALP